MNDKIKKSVEKLITLFPLKNIIVFESIPDFSENTRAVFDEMIKQGVNEKYQLVWTTHEKTELPGELSKLKNVKAVYTKGFKYKYYYSYFAKALIPCNYFIQRRRKEQYYIFVSHGGALKGIKDNRYSVPPECYGCDFVVLSDRLGHYDVKNLNADESKVNITPLGYPRNDALFNSKTDVHKLFSDKQFDKLIYWLPTFRQKKDDNRVYSDIAIPFMGDEESANSVNEAAKKNNVLIVIKPHPAQSTKVIKQLTLSNVCFIDNGFLEKYNVSNYSLLGACDALLTDYSSVYYDYLLCNKPIGLCWEDFEEYSKNEGFILDPEYATRGGVKLYKSEELCDFIESVSKENDTLKSVREQQLKQIHRFCDNRSAERTVKHIMERISKV